MSTNEPTVPRNSDLVPPAETQLLLSKVFRGVTQKLKSGLKYPDILDFVFDSLALVIPYDRMGIAMVDDGPGGERISLKWVKAKMPIKSLTGNYSAPLKGSSLQKIFETGQPRIINDLEQYGIDNPLSISTQLALKDGIKSNMTCPLVANNKRIGIVFFSSREKNTYVNQDVQSFLDVADELSVIIAQGQLRDEYEYYQSCEQNMRMVVHDLKSPLNVISGFLELASLEGWYVNLKEEDKKIFSIIERNTRYMFDLLSELSDMNRIETQDTALELAEVRLVDFCNEIENSEQRIAQKKKISLKICLQAEPNETAKFDRVKIRRVLDNLLTNAFKYSNPLTHVTLQIKSEDSRVVFEVTDEGQGIPAAEITKLFKEYGKTSVKPTDGETSTGLGLAIAKKIVEKHGGDITCTSEPGKGSTFRFWLPRYLHS